MQSKNLRNKYLNWWPLCLSLLFILPSVATDAHAEDIGKIYAVQARQHRLKHEFAFTGGVLPIDAFAKGFTLGGGYSYHMSDFYAIEVVNFHYAFNVNTSLRNDLEQNFGVSTTEFNLIKYILGSSFVIKPVYGKMIFFNRALWHGEASFAFGADAINYDDGILPAAHAGMILRVWMNEEWSVRFDLRDYVSFDGLDPTNILHLGLGFSYSFGAK